MSESSATQKASREGTGVVDKPFLIASALVIYGLVTILIVFSDRAGVVMQAAYNYIGDNFGSLYLVITLLLLVALLWLAFGRFGNVRFGGPDARPEFKSFSWIAMFFCSGMAAALMTWGATEWSYYIETTPFGIEPGSSLAYEYATAYPIYHWGPLGWVVYLFLAYPIGYLYWNRKSGSYSFADSCSGIIGKRNAQGILGKIINFTLLLGLIGAIGSSLGSSTPILSDVLSSIIGIEHTYGVDVAVVLIVTVLFTTSVLFGLKKGIRVFSNINVVLALVMLAAIFIAGPTFFILNNYVNAQGILLQDFLRMSLYTDPVAKTGFPQAWTIFYWAWYYAYAPYMGVFIARISKGRTFREVFLAVILAGSLGCSLFFGVLGGNAIDQQLTGTYDFLGQLSVVGEGTAVFNTLRVLPIGGLILVLFVVCAFIFSTTTIDSAAYSMAQTSCKRIGSEEEPPRYVRLIWALSLGGIALAVIRIGGLTPIKTVSLLTAAPIMVFGVLAMLSLFKWLREDEPQLLEGVERNRRERLAARAEETSLQA